MTDINTQQTNKDNCHKRLLKQKPSHSLTQKLFLISAVALSLQACTTTGSGIGGQPISNPSQPSTNVTNIPTPQITVSDISFLKTVVIPAKNYGNSKMDVSTLDHFLADVTPNARHYPPNFPSKTQRYNTREHLKKYAAWIKPYADDSSASYEVLIRAAQINGMARNLDMGSNYAVAGSNYVARAIKQQPNSIEANLLYGIMLSEGGAFKTARKYLDKAVSLGSVEAEQTIAQADLLNDKKTRAVTRLRQLKMQHPTNPLLPLQISTIESGKYYIWDIPAPNINVRPLS